MQPTGRRQAQARTSAAERHAFVGDHPEIAATGNRIAHSRGVHRCVGLGVFITLANQAEQLLKADELLQEGIGILGQVAHAHQLDEAQFEAALQTVIKQRHDLIEVLPAQRHHVDLDLHPGGGSLIHAIEHAGQIAATGDAAKSRGIESIEGNVDPAQSGIDQQRQFFREELTVGGQTDVVEAHLADGSHERFEFGADQWLAASDAQALDAGRFDQVFDAARHGFGRQFILRSDQPLAVGHAVGTGVIAGRGQADAQIAKTPALTVNDHETLRRKKIERAKLD